MGSRHSCRQPCNHLQIVISHKNEKKMFVRKDLTCFVTASTQVWERVHFACSQHLSIEKLVDYFRAFNPGSPTQNVRKNEWVRLFYFAFRSRWAAFIRCAQTDGYSVAKISKNERRVKVFDCPLLAGTYGTLKKVVLEKKSQKASGMKTTGATNPPGPDEMAFHT